MSSWVGADPSKQAKRAEKLVSTLSMDPSAFTAIIKEADTMTGATGSYAYMVCWCVWCGMFVCV